MQGNKRRDTNPEIAVRRLLHAQGLRYRVDYPLPFNRRRRADIAFPRRKIAVFIDGCFWHGCPEHYAPPKSNTDFWLNKVRQNAERDADTGTQLNAEGWKVLRFWSHQAAEEVAQRIAEAAQ